jgi:hypothetical protein
MRDVQDSEQCLRGDPMPVATGDEDRGIVKVLATDAEGIYVRLYMPRYAERPREVDTSSLALAPSAVAAAMPCSIGHVPLSHATFARWSPILLLRGQSIEDSELMGYRTWQEAEGGSF